MGIKNSNSVFVKKNILILFVFISLAVKAQIIPVQPTDSIVKIEGKKFYMHKVLKGQTLYSILKVYGFTLDELKKLNEGLTENLTAGQIIKIPFKKNKKEPDESGRNEKKEGEFIIHKVKDKETLYTIAKKYNCTIESLKLVNPDLSENIETNQIIKIPRVSENDRSTTQPDVYAKKSGKDTAKIIEPKRIKNEYKIALMIPLYLWEASTIQVNTEDNNLKDLSEQRPFIFMQFLEGALLAVDSLKKQGLSIRLYIYDVNEDSASVTAVFKKPEFDELDLIIGPFYTNGLKMVASHIHSSGNKKNNIKIVSPISTNSEILIDNPNVYKIIPCMQIQILKLAEYISEKCKNCNIILVYKKDAEKNYVDMFRKGKSAITNTLTQNNNIYREYQLSYEENHGLSGLEQLLLKDKENILITLINNEAIISNYIRFFNNVYDKYPITVFGMPGWSNFESIETTHLQNLKYHQFSPSFVNYDNDNVKHFISTFRSVYKTDPDKFAYQGFDVSYFFLSVMKKFGTDFSNELNDIQKYPFSKGMNTKFNFIKEKNNGFENSHIDFFKYENYRLIDTNDNL